MSTTGSTHGTRTRSRNQLLGYIFGAVYVVIGLVGFAVTGGVPFAGQEGHALLLFDVNPLHNIVHLAVGALLLLGASGGPATARSVNILVGAVYLAVGIVGALIGPESALNILALNGADHVLHLASALLLLGVGLTQDRTVDRATRR